MAPRLIEGCYSSPPISLEIHASDPASRQQQVCCKNTNHTQKLGTHKKFESSDDVSHRHSVNAHFPQILLQHQSASAEDPNAIVLNFVRNLLMNGSCHSDVCYFYTWGLGASAGSHVNVIPRNGRYFL